MTAVEVEPGQVWRNDVGQKFLVVRVEGEWVYTKDPRAPKKSRATGDIPLAWFSRPGWTVVS